MSGIVAKSGKKNRKHGNNKVFCARYEAEGRRLKNKRKKLLRHIKSHADDRQSLRALRTL